MSYTVTIMWRSEVDSDTYETKEEAKSVYREVVDTLYNEDAVEVHAELVSVTMTDETGYVIDMITNFRKNPS